MKFKAVLLAASLFTAFSIINTISATDRDRLSDGEIMLVKMMLAKLEPYISERKKLGDANMLTFEELYSRLDSHEQIFMNEIRHLKPLPAHKQSQEIAQAAFVAIENQMLSIPDPSNSARRFTSIIERQYLPKNVLAAYQKMMDAMDKDIQKQLLIESGYRSPAYQLYLFVYYLQNHAYSIKETNRWVALPGFSEHGSPERQAIDFINLEGVSGENHPEDFEKLKEYEWLVGNANRFGFVMSYPKNNNSNSAFEPWHWRYEPETK